MTQPHSTLSSSSAVSLALSALSVQGRYGAVTRLAEEHEVSRQGVYRIRERALGALEGEFSEGAAEPAGPPLWVDEAHIRRAVVALRVGTPASIRDIEDVLPEVLGVHWSYGKIHGVIEEAQQLAATRLAEVDLSSIQNVALDEMFSQGSPVLGGIDMDFGFLFTLEASPSRSGAEWASVLGALRQEQGLVPSMVVKDAGSGLAAGVSRIWPEAEQRDDLFHAVYDMGRLAGQLERRAYAVIGVVDDLARQSEAAKSERKRRQIGQKLRHAREKMDKEIQRYDRFEALRREAANVLQLTERGDGRPRRSKEVRETLRRIATDMQAIGSERISKLSTYLSNRAAGLVTWLDALQLRLDQLGEEVGGSAVVHAVLRAWQASWEVDQGGPAWDRKARRIELHAAADHLVNVVNHDNGRLLQALTAVLPVVVERHRASSTIECLNSVLRPYLVVQKSANQGFLDLFRFYWNTRVRRWGRWKGTSALELLTHREHPHWLTLLGFPPGDEAQAAA